MKTLKQHIEEKLVINKNYKNDDKYFIYKLDKKVYLKIFDNNWPQFKDYKDKVYINGEHVELNHLGRTIQKYEPGIYKVEIKDIDKITSCNHIFYFTRIIKIPYFDTSKVENMEEMFGNCMDLKEVPLLDTKNVRNMWNMFSMCIRLNKETKQQWSKIYDFETDTKIK